MLEDTIGHNFMNVRELITEIREEERGGGERVHAEETAGWRFQDNLRIRGEHLNSPYMKRI